MLRALILYLSQASWAKNLVTNWSFAWRMAGRFVAGETLAEVVPAVQALNAKGIEATLDHLGEHTTTPDEARQATEEILQIFDAIDAAGLRAGVSIKLTQIGLALDPQLCAQNLERIVQTAVAHANFVRIDMEDHPWTDKTLDLYCQMHALGYGEHTGVVIQSYLYRSEADVDRILSVNGRVRLCKGAYNEPPEVAFPKKEDVDRNYDALARQLIDGAQKAGAPEISSDGKFPPIPAFATHDPARIEFACRYAEQVGLPKRALEFQMLYGIRREVQENLAQAGYPVRVYVPFGSQWYPYFMRRLAERPANVWFFVSNFFRN